MYAETTYETTLEIDGTDPDNAGWRECPATAELVVTYSDRPRSPANHWGPRDGGAEVERIEMGRCIVNDGGEEREATEAERKVVMGRAREAELVGA